MKIYVFPLLLAGLAGCSMQSYQQYGQPKHDVTADEYQQLVQQQSVCCQDFADVSYAPIPVGQESTAKIDKSSPLFKFADGVAYFAAYQVPDDQATYKINLSFNIYKQVFLPEILILNKNYQITHIYNNELFERNPNAFVEQANVEREFQMGGDDRAYMILYVPHSKVGKEFTVESEKALFNRKHNYARPPESLRYRQVSYQPFGSFEVSSKKLSSELVTHYRMPVARPASTPAATTTAASVTGSGTAKATQSTAANANVSTATAAASAPVPVVSSDFGPTQDSGYASNFIRNFYTAKPLALQRQEDELYKNIVKSLQEKKYKQAFEQYRTGAANGINDADRILLQALNQF